MTVLEGLGLGDRVRIGLACLATAFAVLARGGFTGPAKTLFALLAGLALLASLSADRAATVRAARSPVPLILGALAILAVASAAWTVGSSEKAVQYGLAVAGYAALVIAAAAIASERRGRVAIYATIAALAAVSGLIGLVGAAVQEFPYGQRVAGSWQAGGSFEYAPPNVLLQLAALPVLLAAMAGSRRSLALLAAAGAAIAGAVIGLSDSLFGQLLAAAILLIAIAVPGATLARPRRVAVAAAALVSAAALAAHLIAGRFAEVCDVGGDGARLAGLAAVTLAAAATWAIARHPLLGEQGSRVAPLGALAAALAIAAGGLIADPETPCVSGTRAIEPSSGIFHGRTDLWGAGLDAGFDRPLHGAGADAFYLAADPYLQSGSALYAHDLPLELWAELGIAGALLAIALYAAVAAALLGARGSPALWLAGPGVVAFMLSNLIDWPWHLAGAGAVWALGLGILISAARPPPPDRARHRAAPRSPGR